MTAARRDHRVVEEVMASALTGTAPRRCCPRTNAATDACAGGTPPGAAPPRRPQPGDIPGYHRRIRARRAHQAQRPLIALAARSAKDFAVEALITERNPVPETETLAKGLPSAAARGAVAYRPGGGGHRAASGGRGRRPGRAGAGREARLDSRRPPAAAGGRPTEPAPGAPPPEGGRRSPSGREEGPSGGQRGMPPAVAIGVRSRIHLPRLRPGSSGHRARGSLAPPACESLRSARAPRGGIGEGAIVEPEAFLSTIVRLLRATSHVRRISQRRAIRLRRCFFRPAPQTSARAPGRRGARCPRPRPSLPFETRQEAQGDPPVPPRRPRPRRRVRGPRRLVRLKARGPGRGRRRRHRRASRRDAARSRTSRASRTWSRATGCSEATTRRRDRASLLPRDRARRNGAGGPCRRRCGDCARWRRVVTGAHASRRSAGFRTPGNWRRRRTREKKPRKPMYEVFTREHVAGLAASTARRLGAEAPGGEASGFWSSAGIRGNDRALAARRERWTRRGEWAASAIWFVA